MTDPAGGAAAGDLRPPVPVKLAYAFGQAIESGYIGAAAFVFFYYTAVLGLSGKLVGLALAVAMVADAVLDPLIGSATDNIRSRFGRRLPPMIVGAPLMAASTVMLFAPPSGLAALAMFAWLTVAKLSIRAFASLFNLPYFALGAEMASGAAGRASVVAYRTIFGIVFGVLLTVLAYSVYFAGPGGLQNADRYPAFGLTLAIIFLVCGWFCCLGLWRYVVRLPQPTTPPQPLLAGFASGIAEVSRNASFRTLFLSAFVVYAASGLQSTIAPYAYIFAFHLTSSMIQTVTFALLLGLAMGVPLAPLALRYLEKRTAVMLGLGVIMVGWAGLPLARALGVFHPEGQAALWFIAANVWLQGFGLALPAIAYPSMLADAADEHELNYGSRREALYFAGLGFANKAAVGLGGLLAGLAIDAIHFPKDAGRTVGAVIPEPVIQKLMLAWGPAPAIFGAIATAMLLPYGITRARHEVIAARLRAKRADDVAEGRST